MKGVQCYDLFGGIALKIHTFSFFFISSMPDYYYDSIRLLLYLMNVCCVLCVLLSGLTTSHRLSISFTLCVLLSGHIT